jgi:hypothetical protein
MNSRPACLRRQGTAAVIAASVVWLFSGGSLPTSSRKLESPRAREHSPQLILWAWERPEDLRFLGQRRVGVAVLAGTVHLRGEDVLVDPRHQPLRMAPGAFVIAVTRIEIDSDVTPVFSDSQVSRMAGAVVRLSRIPGIAGVQIDFDALESQRSFYRSVISATRAGVPSSVPLSITALASWCLGDRWMKGLPIDEAVPMLFRMGRDGASVVRQMRRRVPFRDSRCRESLGLSIDELEGWERPATRIYVFNPRPWTPQALESVERLLEQAL